MEGPEVQVYKRDHHTTAIPESIVTMEKKKRRRLRTPVIIKLIFAITFISVWWLLLNIYMMNHTDLQPSSKLKEVDPKHLEDTDGEEVAGVGDSFVEGLFNENSDYQYQQGGNPQGLDEVPQQQRVEIDDDDDDDDVDYSYIDRIDEERAPKRKKEPEKLQNADQESDFQGNQVQNAGQQQRWVEDNGNLANNNIQGFVNANAENADDTFNNMQGFFNVGNDGNLAQNDNNNLQGFANAGGQIHEPIAFIKNTLDSTPVNDNVAGQDQMFQNDFANAQDNNVAWQQPQFDNQGFNDQAQVFVNDQIQQGQVDMAQVNFQQNADQGLDQNFQGQFFDGGNNDQVNFNVLENNDASNNQNGVNAVENMAFNDQNAGDAINPEIKEKMAQAAAESFDDEEVNPAQKVGEKVAQLIEAENQIREEQNEMQGLQNVNEQNQMQGFVAPQENNFQQVDQERDQGFFQNQRVVEERDEFVQNDDMAQAQVKMVQDRLLVAEDESHREHNLWNMQDRMVQNNRLDNLQNDQHADDYKENAERNEANDFNQNREKNKFDVQEPGAFVLNNEQKREIERREIRQHELAEKMREFLENGGQDEPFKNMNIERQRPAQEKIKNVNERTLPYDPSGPGEEGQGLKELPWEHESVQKEWSKTEFNLYFSDKISLERSLPDGRPPKCSQRYYAYSSLPKTSIIICFTDEAWSPLLRSLHSIINRSPPELVEEIILVDDFSQSEDLQKPLEDYIVQFPQVKLIRLPERNGLIRARLAGVEAARGPVLTFLDSHIEVSVGWLEPLLDRIREDRTNVVTPVIDVVDAHSFKYVVANDRLRGGFTWIGLQFRWKNAPNEVWDARRDETDGIPSPTMAGGLFSIDKQFFIELGSYDPGLEIWGAENIELSFKTWMCGGRIEVLPCSRVGHIFRRKQPYSFPSGSNLNTFIHNTLRVVNVWMDDYKDVFYAVNPQYAHLDYGDISERLQLRDKLQCQSFEWYINNIYTDLDVPPSDTVANGSLVNLKSQLCLDKNGEKSSLAVFPCHNLGGNQAFRLTRQGVLAVADVCILAADPRKGPVRDGPCNSKTLIHWEHTQNGLLKNKETGMCLGVAADKKLAFMPCFQGGAHLQWTFQNYLSQGFGKAEVL